MPYIEKKEIKTLTSIAKPVIVFNGENTKNVEYLNLNKCMYEFSVKNFNDNVNSDVGMKYNIMFELSQKNAPVIINLYRKTETGEEKIELSNYKTVNCEVINLGDKQKNYRVEVFYNTKSNEIMNENFKVNVIVQAMQKEVNVG